MLYHFHFGQSFCPMKKPRDTPLTQNSCDRTQRSFGDIEDLQTHWSLWSFVMALRLFRLVVPPGAAAWKAVSPVATVRLKKQHLHSRPKVDLFCQASCSPDWRTTAKLQLWKSVLIVTLLHLFIYLLNQCSIHIYVHSRWFRHDQYMTMKLRMRLLLLLSKQTILLFCI